MGKIYRRSNLICGVTVKKEDKNRKRNIILNFRVSEEEKHMIENRIKLSGLAKADYLIKSCLHQEIVTYGNVKTFSEIRQQIAIIDKHLLALTKMDELELEVLESLRTILEILDGIKKESKLNE
ncbi:MAG: plasmid mobilization protein [Suipraeoptans sp.]